MRVMRRTFSITTAAASRCPWPDGRLLPSQSLQNDKKGVSAVSVNSPAIFLARDQRGEIQQDFVGLLL